MAFSSAHAAENGIHNKIYIGGDIVYSECTTGSFTYNGDTYNNKPVYQNDSGTCRGADWFVFYHNNRWSISFQSPLVSPSHGVTNGLASAWPWDAQWPGGAIVTGVPKVIIGGDIVYPECTTGSYVFDYSAYNGKPVYRRENLPCRGSSEWFMFYHNNRWSISFQSPFTSPSHGVTNGLQSDHPWDDVWPGGATVTTVYN